LESNGVIANGSTLLSYLTSGGTANAVTVAPAAGGSISGLNLTTSQLTIGDNNTNTVSNSIVASAIAGTLTSALTNILYSTAGSSPSIALTLNSGVNLVTTSPTTYTLDGSEIASGAGKCSNSDNC
jgi:hypothetical protein